MNKIKGISSNSEYKDRFFKGVRYLQKATMTNAVEPAKPAMGAFKDPLPNQTYSLSGMYEHATQMRKIFRDLSDRERKLKDLMEFARKHPDELYAMIMAVVKSFNQASASLYAFDKLFSTVHSDELRNLTDNYQFSLASMGIRIVGINQLQVDENQFRKALIDAPEVCMEICVDKDGFFENAYHFFLNIRLPSNHTENDKYDSSEKRLYLFDRKG